MSSAAETELRARGCPGAAAKLVELHPDQSAELVEAWNLLYVPAHTFRLEERIDPRANSTTEIGSGTFCTVHVDKDDATRVVMVARYSFSGATDWDSDDAATFSHYANTLDSAVRIRSASLPDTEPRWAAAPESFTLLVDEKKLVWFVFFMPRCVPLTEHPAYLNRKHDPAGIRKLMWSVAASAWFVENKAWLAHRDIKPANVLVTREGRAVLADFGSARPMGSTGNPSYYMNPPWMDPMELLSIQSAVEYRWEHESSAFAMGLLMLKVCWDDRRYSTMFPQQMQPRWVRSVIMGRERGYYKKHRRILNGVLSTPHGLIERAALMLANPTRSERCTLAYVEHALRPRIGDHEDPAVFVELPAELQRSSDGPAATRPEATQFRYDPWTPTRLKDAAKRLVELGFNPAAKAMEIETAKQLGKKRPAVDDIMPPAAKKASSPADKLMPPAAQKASSPADQLMPPAKPKYLGPTTPRRRR